MEIIERENPQLIIGVGGCVASQEGEQLRQRAPCVDVIFGPQTLHRLPEMINHVQGTNSPVVDISFPEIENLTVCQNHGLKAQLRLFRSWKAAIILYILCRTLHPRRGSQPSKR